MLVDPHGNINNHNAVLIDRALYRAMRLLYNLENSTITRIREIAKDYPHHVHKEDDE
jgi:hypothetical protein